MSLSNAQRRTLSGVCGRVELAGRDQCRPPERPPNRTYPRSGLRSVHSSKRNMGWWMVGFPDMGSWARLVAGWVDICFDVDRDVVYLAFGLNVDGPD